MNKHKYNIQAAIDLFNVNNAGKKRLNLSLLAQLVIKDRKNRSGNEIDVQRKRQFMSCWNTGNGVFAAPTEKELKAIAKVTGQSVKFITGE